VKNDTPSTAIVLSHRRAWQLLQAVRWRMALSTAVWIVLEWRERSRSRRALERLDDHLLRDVGLSRADAWQESRKPFWKL
jgi:uncharacterized protein YjiS (DUF1127 family)